MDKSKQGQFSNFGILLVDNDSKTRSEVSTLLQPYGFQIFSVDDTLKAKDVLKKQTIHLVIFESRLPNESGLELAQWVRRIFDSSFRQTMPLPMILLTGFPHLLKKEELGEYALSACLDKPVQEQVFLEGIFKALRVEEHVVIPRKETKKMSQEQAGNFEEQRQYCKIVLNDFLSQNTLEMDIYIRIADEKFLKIAKKGEKVDEIQFSRYREKGLNFIYTKREDYKKILNFNMKLNKAVSKSDQLTLETKKKFMAKTAEVLLEDCFVNGINQQAYEEAQTYVLDSVNTLLKEDDSFYLLEILNDHSDYLYAHSLGVSLYSVMIGKTLGWKSGANLFKLCYGALMHDIGKKDFSRELLLKPTQELSFEEKSLLETHPERGKEILEKLKSVPSEVVSIAYEHHENVLGQGYPSFLHKNYISPMARIVSVADEFCKFAIKNPDRNGVKADRAIELINLYKEKLLDPKPLNALRRIANYQGVKTRAS